MFDGYFTTMSPYKLTLSVIQKLKISSAKLAISTRLAIKLATRRFFHCALPYLDSVTGPQNSKSRKIY